MSEIRIITEPKVRLVGRQVIDEAALSEFLVDEGAESWTTDTDIAAQRLVEIGGRLCYKSYAKPRPGGNHAYISHLLEVGHGSVIESAVYNFIITGVSRSFTHEMVRHRAGWAYSQRSQRFCDEAEGAFVMPPLIANLQDEDEWIRDRWKRLVGEMQEAYSELSHDLTNILKVEAYRAAGSPCPKMYENYIDAEEVDEAIEWGKSLPLEARTAIRKKAREAARSVLPNATETQIFVTVNARALRTFLEQRGSKEADAEIRSVAIAICRIMKAESPNLFFDFEEATAEDGTLHLTNKYRKV